MNTTTYIPQAHSFVTIKVPDNAVAMPHFIDMPKMERVDMHAALFGPHAIVHHTGNFVWIALDHNFVDVFAEIKMVSDGREYGFSAEGNCILSVPASWCQYLDEAEAMDISMCMDADAKLLSYAIG